jgi:hypothetical protein
MDDQTRLPLPFPNNSEITLLLAVEDDNVRVYVVIDESTVPEAEYWGHYFEHIANAIARDYAGRGHSIDLEDGDVRYAIYAGFMKAVAEGHLRWLHKSGC